MRDPERIPRIVRLLQAAWEREPDLRLGQLVVNLCPGTVGMRDDEFLSRLFNCEDDEWARVFELGRASRG